MIDVTGFVNQPLFFLFKCLYVAVDLLIIGALRLTAHGPER